jgi:hypothetical protein
MDQFQIRDKMHREFPEWEGPQGSAREIPVERILEALNKSTADAEQIRQNTEEKKYLEKLFGTPRATTTRAIFGSSSQT